MRGGVKGMVRRLARDAVIFMLLGMMLAVVGGFIQLQRSCFQRMTATVWS